MSSYWYIAIKLSRRIYSLVIKQVEVDIAKKDDKARLGVGVANRMTVIDPLTGEV